MRMAYIALISAILIAGCAGTQVPINNIASVVAEGSKIDVDYTGSLLDGTVFDSSVGRTPLQFNAGTGQMIKGFDAAVIGMHAGEEKNVTLAPGDAYGAYNPNLTVEVPIENIPNNTKVGDTLYAGQQPAVVLKLNSTSALMDINHPLAGKTLLFRIRIMKIY